MLIKIKTQEEFRSDHVTIEIVADRHELDSAMSGPDRVATWRDSLNRDQLLAEVERLESGLERYRKAHVCTVECKPNQHTAFQGRQRVAELESELERRTQERDEREAARAKLERETTEAIRVLERKVFEYDLDRTTERDRADQNKAWAERAEARLAKDAEVHVRIKSDLDRHIEKINVRLSEALGDRNRLAAQIGRIKDGVHSPVILAALRTAWEYRSKDRDEALANAVRNVRQIVGSPEPETSQA